MLDPFPPPPAWVRRFIEPYALRFNSPTLPEHIHEILLAFSVYQFIHYVLSPWLSPIFFSKYYPHFNRRTKINWDVHVVSLFQSILINSAALWIMFVDKERKSMSTGERVFGYTGACGMIQALAVAYFLYDLIISLVYVRVFGIGLLFHAVSALWVFSLGFRPFVNFYAPVFVLYELSTPFLNIHWFLDKVNMTGSRAQWYNGMLLLFVFFSCRLVWGTWQSALVYRDMWNALQQTWSASSASSLLSAPVNINAQVFHPREGKLCLDETCARANAEIPRFAAYTASGVPTWLVATYVISNLVLNALNYYWFSKMIDTVLKRFREPAKAAVKEEERIRIEKVEKLTEDIVLEAAAKLEEEQSAALLPGDLQEQISSAVDARLGEELRRRKSELAAKMQISN